MNIINKDKKNSWWQLIIGAFIGAILTLLVNIYFYHYTNKSPELIYKVFPVSYYYSESNKNSIYNIFIENIGDKEAIDVQAYFKLDKGSRIIEFKVKASHDLIQYKVNNSNKDNIRLINFDSLNPLDSCSFTVVAENTGNSNPEFELRAKGVTGIEREVKKEKNGAIRLLFFGLFLGFLGLLLLLIITIKTKRNSEKLDDIDKIIKELRKPINIK